MSLTVRDFRSCRFRSIQHHRNRCRELGESIAGSPIAEIRNPPPGPLHPPDGLRPGRSASAGSWRPGHVGLPTRPRVPAPATGWPATLPGDPGGSPEAGGSIAGAQGAARAAPGRDSKITPFFKFLNMKPPWPRSAWKIQTELHNKAPSHGASLKFIKS